MTRYHVGPNSGLDEFRAARDGFVTAPYPAWTAVGVTELAAEGGLVKIRGGARRP